MSEPTTIPETLLGNLKPATDRMLQQIAESARDVREHDHGTQVQEDLFCQNLTAWMGERMGGVLRRLLDAEARVTELEAAQQRVQHSLAPRWDLAPEVQDVVDTALSDHHHVHEYRDFGPYAGSRCVTCNLPAARSAEDDACPGCGLIDPRGVHDGTCEVAADEKSPPFSASELTVFQAQHDSIVMGLYTTAVAARDHCEAYIRREISGASLDWIEDEEDGVAELVAAFGEDERPTGYVVTTRTVASAYDEEGEE